MNEQQLINEARKSDPEAPIESLEDALEWFYMNGFVDASAGDVECPLTGFFYRINRWIVTTDSQGFHGIHDYGTEEAAEAAFEDMDEEYSEWYEEN